MVCQYLILAFLRQWNASIAEPIAYLRPRSHRTRKQICAQIWVQTLWCFLQPVWTLTFATMCSRICVRVLRGASTNQLACIEAGILLLDSRSSQNPEMQPGTEPWILAWTRAYILNCIEAIKKDNERVPSLTEAKEQTICRKEKGNASSFGEVLINLSQKSLTTSIRFYYLPLWVLTEQHMHSCSMRWVLFVAHWRTQDSDSPHKISLLPWN